MNIPALPRPIGERALEFGDVTGEYPAVWHHGHACALNPDSHLNFMGAIAHAHTSYSVYGLICISPIGLRDGGVTEAHEYAHLLVAPFMSRREWMHGPRWRKALTDLGFAEEADEYVGWRM